MGPTRQAYLLLLVALACSASLLILSTNYPWYPSALAGVQWVGPVNRPHLEHSLLFNLPQSEGNRSEQVEDGEESATDRCTPVRHFAFVKTHKCASDTLAVHLMRIVEERGLEMVTPVGEWNLHWPSAPGDFYRSRKPSGRFDATALHMMYHRRTWSQFMEPDTRYFGVLREPLAQFKSYFNYFGLWRRMNEKHGVPVSDTFDTFLNNPKPYLEVRGWQNPMAVDFGFVNGETKFAEFLQTIVEEMDLMLISDYFDESMLLLRHEFCWPMSDVIYKTKNVAKVYRYGEKEIPPDVRKAQESRYAEFAKMDHALFKHFNATFWQKIQKIPRFHEELTQYRSVLAQTSEFCQKNPDENSAVTIQGTELHESILLDRELCQGLSRGIFQHIKLIQSRYNQTSPKYGKVFPAT